jgi:hypothetical protein
MILSSLRAITASTLLLLPTPGDGGKFVFPPDARPHGRSYAEWSAAWWTWNMEHPVAGHPSIDDPAFDVTSGQSGNVWFLATPVAFGTATPPALTRTITIPRGTALFIGTLAGEMSSNEGATTEAEQREIANFQADRITDLTCTIDGKSVDLAAHRAESPQFSFTAPDPWIFSPSPAGVGTAVGDGYYLFVKPLAVGQHVVRYTGRFHFESGIFGPEPFDISADQTYVINVTP